MQGGFPLAPLHPLRGVGVPMQVYAPAGAPKGFPRGKQSARPALPCAPRGVCLNSGSLTAFGGCAHWARASLRSPCTPFGSPLEAIERLIGLHALPSRRSRRVRPHQREISTAKLLPMMQTGGFPRGKPSAQPALPCAPLTVCLTSSAPEPAHPPPRGSAPAHSRISFLRSQNSAPERKENAHALFCRW